MAFEDKKVDDLKRGDFLTAKWLNDAKNAKTNIIGAGLVQVSKTPMGTVVRVDEPKRALRWGVVKESASDVDFLSQYININPCEVRVNSDGDYQITSTNTNVVYKMYLEISPSDIVVDSDNTKGIAAYPFETGQLVPMLYTGTSEAVLYGNTVTEIVGRVVDSDLGNGKYKFFKSIPVGNSSSLTLNDTTVSDYAWDLNIVGGVNASDTVEIIHKIETQGSDVYLYRNPKFTSIFPASITGESSGSYAWTEQTVANTTGAFTAKTGGRSGTTGTNPAKEFNGIVGLYNASVTINGASVTVGASKAFVVQMHEMQSADGTKFYKFYSPFPPFALHTYDVPTYNIAVDTTKGVAVVEESRAKD